MTEPVRSIDCMTKPSTLQTRREQATARVNAASASVRERSGAATRQQEQIDRAAQLSQASPKSVDLNQQWAIAKEGLRRINAEIVTAQAEEQRARNALEEIERLLRGDDALVAAKAAWSAASAAQVQATKGAQEARAKLAKLDALLAEEQGKTAAAQDAQRAAILARLGFSDKPAEAVSAVEEVLIGSAATVDALRAGRPALEALAVEAEKGVADCDKATRQAVRGILLAKQAIAERAAMESLAECRAAVMAHHVATMAVGAPFARLELYDQSEGPGWIEREAEGLKELAFIGI